MGQTPGSSHCVEGVLGLAGDTGHTGGTPRRLSVASANGSSTGQTPGRFAFASGLRSAPKPETDDQSAVALDVGLGQVAKQSAPLPHELQ